MKQMWFKVICCEGVVALCFCKMNDETNFFAKMKWTSEKLIEYGFSELGDKYSYQTFIANGAFVLQVLISKDGVYTNVYDPKNDFEYVLHKIPEAEGKFVGKIREEYLEILNQIRVQCFVPDVFKSFEAQAIMSYASEKYASKPEYLWNKLPEAAVLRNPNSAKWFAIFMRIDANKLGLLSQTNIEIIDLKANPDNVLKLIDNVKIFPGYHMNKKHWITICLNNSVHISDILTFVDESYILSQKS